MKRAFAIIIVVLLALGMIGLFFPAFLSGQQVQVGTPEVQTTPAQ